LIEIGQIPDKTGYSTINMKQKNTTIVVGAVIMSVAFLMISSAFIFKNDETDSSPENGNKIKPALETNILGVSRRSRVNERPSSYWSRESNPISKVEEGEDPSQIVLRLLQVDVEKAITYVNSIQDDDVKATLYGTIAHAWAKSNPDASYAWAKSLASPGSMSSALTGIILSLIQSEDVPKAVNFINQTTSGELKDDMIVYGLNGIADKNLNIALQMVNDLSGKGALLASSKILAEKIFTNIPITEFEQTINEIPYGYFRTMLESSLVKNLADSDPNLAFDWVMSSSNPEIKNTGYKIIAATLGSTDPSRGFALSDKIDNPLLRSQFLQQIGTTWGRNNPESAKKWVIGQIGAGAYDENKHAINAALAEIIQWNQESVVKEILAIGSEHDRDEVAMVAVGTLSKFQPLQASQLLASVAGSENSAAAITATTQLASNWLQRDSLAASQWISELSRGSSKDSAISVLVMNILSKDNDPMSARNWAYSIDDQEQRSLAIARVSEYERLHGK